MNDCTPNTNPRNISVELVELMNSGIPFSDILIEQDAPVMVKCPGGWTSVDTMDWLTGDDMKELLNNLDPNWEQNILRGSINRPINLWQWRLRINAYLAGGNGSLMMSIRRLPANAPTLKDTGLPQSVRLMIENPRGLILISGATGSGKSTTLAALIECINESRNAHIITIEDPIEYKFRRKKSIFSQREVGADRDCPSFFDGVRDAMRQRPDVIVIGEIRDKDTAEAALLAGESGHLVIGTVHANTAPGAVQKLLAFFPSHEREGKLQALAAILVGSVSQILLPSSDKKGYALAAELLFNHKGQFSNVLGDSGKLTTSLECADDGVSQTMVASLAKLVADGRVAKADALRAITAGQAMLHDRLKQIAA